MFYGQFNPPVDKEIYERYFLGKTEGISIECGAFDGVTDSCTKFFEESMNWKTINIEALPIAYDRLVKNRPNSINLNIGLSNNNISKQFVNYKEPRLDYMWGNGSFTHLPEHKKHLEERCDNNYQTIEINCDTYAHLLETLKLEKLDLFVLDVEGHEFEVIDGMVESTIFPDIFVIEHGHRNPKDFVEKLKILKNVKYKLDHVSYVNSFFKKI